MAVTYTARLDLHMAGKHSQSTHGRAKSAGFVQAMKDPGGGFTLSRKGAAVSSGYAVALPGSSGFITNAFTPSGKVKRSAVQAVKDWFKDNADKIAEAGHVGGWHNPATGELTLDIVKVLPDSVGDSAAISAGKAANQEGIFHLTSGRYIDTGGTGDER